MPEQKTYKKKCAKIIKEIREEVKDEITCIICYDIVIDYITTKCKHICCTSCYKSLRRTSDSVRMISCPMCRRPVYASDVIYTLYKSPAVTRRTDAQLIIHQLKSQTYPVFAVYELRKALQSNKYDDDRIIYSTGKLRKTDQPTHNYIPASRKSNKKPT
jgi:hypothetical protein